MVPPTESPLVEILNLSLLLFLFIEPVTFSHRLFQPIWDIDFGVHFGGRLGVPAISRIALPKGSLVGWMHPRELFQQLNSVQKQSEKYGAAGGT